MTDRGQAVLKKMKLRRLFDDAKRRDQILRDFNASTLDPVGPLGGDQEIKVLKEMNEMQDLQSNAGRKECPDR